MQQFHRTQWNLHSDDLRVKLAKSLLDVLPKGFAFSGVTAYEMGDQRNHIAEFMFDQLRFCLVPGDTVELGYDPRKPMLLRREHGNPHRTKLATLREAILQGCTPVRTCHFAPMIVEALPTRLGFRVVSADDQELAEILRRRNPGDSFEHYGPDFTLCRDDDGVVTVARKGETTHERVTKDFAQQGFRLPTNDEWEYLCGAGSRTFFRWGNDCPCDRYPNDRLADAKIIELAQRWEPGEPIWDPVRGEWEWGKHRMPNAFGMEIARNPYDLEVVSSPGFYRGGDGGAATCGGACYFEGWLSLATAWQVRVLSDEDQKSDLAGRLGRRVLTVKI